MNSRNKRCNDIFIGIRVVNILNKDEMKLLYTVIVKTLENSIFIDIWQNNKYLLYYTGRYC